MFKSINLIISFIFIFVALFSQAGVSPPKLNEINKPSNNNCLPQQKFESIYGDDESFCISLDNSIVFLWVIGCPPCVDEFNKIVFPFLEKNPKYKKTIYTAVLVNSLENSEEVLSWHIELLKKMPLSKKANHIVVERKSNVIWDAVKKNEEVYPSMVVINQDTSTYVSPINFSDLESFSKAGTYTEFVKNIINELKSKDMEGENED